MKGPLGGLFFTAIGILLLWKSIAVRNMAAHVRETRGDPTRYWEWGAKAHLWLAGLAVLMMLSGIAIFIVRLLA